jgi:hypothetical protein
MLITEVSVSPRSDSIEDVERRLGDTTSVRGAIADTLDETTRVAEQTIELFAPEGRTRGLKGAVGHTPARSEMDGTIVARAGVGEVASAKSGSRRYPYDVHEGTGLYGHLKKRIRSPTGKVMRIPGPTGIAYATSTQGQKAQPFVAEAVPDVEGYLEQRFDPMVRRILGD